MLIPSRSAGVTTYTELHIPLFCKGLQWTTIWQPLMVGHALLLLKVSA